MATGLCTAARKVTVIRSRSTTTQWTPLTTAREGPRSNEDPGQPKITKEIYIKKKRKEMLARDLPGGPVVKILSFHCRGAEIQSLVRGLKSYMPHGPKKLLTRNMVPFDRGGKQRSHAQTA